jgi:hypothetical protein
MDSMTLETNLFYTESHHLRLSKLMQINRAGLCPGKLAIELVVGISADQVFGPSALRLPAIASEIRNWAESRPSGRAQLGRQARSRGTGSMAGAPSPEMTPQRFIALFRMTTLILVAKIASALPTQHKSRSVTTSTSLPLAQW